MNRYRYYARSPYAPARFGALTADDLLRTDPPEPEPPPESLSTAFAKITPTLVLVGIATGAAFAIGSALVGRYLFSASRPRRSRR